MPIHFIRTLTSPHRTHRSDMQLGIILAFIAGAINAGGFLAVGFYTSHMTGIVSSIGDAIALDQWHIAKMAILFLASFTLGAIVSSIVINIARAKKLASEFAIALMLEALLLLAFGISASQYYSFTLSPITTISLLCFIMGLQNAIITKISHAEIRTTHVTGIVTDIGIELGRYLYNGFSKSEQARLHPEKLQLHSSLLAAFIIGAIIGAISFQYAGFIMIMPLAITLIVLAGIPIFDDCRK